MEHFVNLGDEVKDFITGFKGITIGISTYLHGCRHVMVQPEGLKDGKAQDAVWIEEPRLVVTRKGKHAKPEKETGGPMLRRPSK